MLTESPNSLFNCQRPRCRCSRPLLGGPRELGEVTPRCPPRQALFFNFLSRRQCASTVPRIPRRRGVSTLARPARQHFFSTPTKSLQSAVSRFPARGVGLSTRPLAARQHFFSILRRGASALRSVSGFPKSGGAYLRPSLRPVNTFFQVCSAFAIRSCPVPRARAGFSTQPLPARQHLFSNSCERLAAASPARPGFPQREGASTWAGPGRQAKDYPRPWYFPKHRPGRRSGSPGFPGAARNG